ncbi:FG-GAP-like repeat-containing protein [Roseomonas sp. NAR14]|uniref:FG-GAP-like repeat-containing protein n=1 Tax=Roseomonas acroporae TaxID=2937791 RepID=A0A9X2BU56_9PROT|nr:FG-GAP-like repeat-containing protein [Roseomonas acroporae]MCK8785323.1 FG-GAP-like repeat-containing protein [Roseomonas acroporae]
MARRLTAFAATSADGRELWLTDGTAAGTFQLADINRTAPGASGNPADLVDLGSGLMLFTADDGIHGREVWVTDGTPARTTMVSDRNAGSAGLAPLKVVPAEDGGAYFFVLQPDGSTGAFLIGGDPAHLIRDMPAYGFTDGVGLDAEGTLLATATALYSYGRRQGLRDYYPLHKLQDMTFPAGGAQFTALGNGNAVFVRHDAATGDELGGSNGLASGTGVVRDIRVGSGGSNIVGLTALGHGRAVFSADDGIAGQEPWVTDGTWAGTFRLGDLFPGGAGSQPAGFTALGNGKAVFAADDGVHGTELWVTDGTVAGTTLLADLRPGAAGSAYALGQYGMVALGLGKAAFLASTDGGVAFWITDGTAAGTHGVVAPVTVAADAVDGAVHVRGGATGDGRFLFEGAADHAGELWVSDGTAAGTQRIASIPPGTATDAFLSDFTVIRTPAPVAQDFDGDGHSNLLLRHDNGLLAIWTMNGIRASNAVSPGPASLDWSLRDVKDFDGDGRADILWQHADGTVLVWAMDGGTVIGGGTAARIGPEWRYGAAGDLDGDGRADIVWQNADGTLAYWRMNGGEVVGGSAIGTLGAGWSVRAAADFDGDGRDDLLLSDDAGHIALWRMDGPRVASADTVATLGPEWHFRGTGDFDGDGRADILLQNDAGLVAMWFMDGARIAGGGAVGAIGPQWAIRTIGDYDGDGHSDIMLEDAGGRVFGWLMDGTHILNNGGDVSRVDPHWQVIA